MKNSNNNIFPIAKVSNLNDAKDLKKFSRHSTPNEKILLLEKKICHRKNRNIAGKDYEISARKSSVIQFEKILRLLRRFTPY